MRLWREAWLIRLWDPGPVLMCLLSVAHEALTGRENQYFRT